MKLGMDIGGTFTDLVLVDESNQTVYFGKTLTTYPDPTPGILNVVNELLHQHGKQGDQVKILVHGTTLVTNAVIESKGASCSNFLYYNFISAIFVCTGKTVFQWRIIF